MLGFVQDITERKASEEALRESNERLESRVAERTQKLSETIAELESFSYSISHDLRAPLRAMQGYSIILQEDHAQALGRDGQDYINRIARSAERMDRLVQDILVLSKVARSDLKLEPLDVSALMRSILESYPHFHSSKAEIEVSNPLPNVLANEAALTQCISNLLGNAIKFVGGNLKPHVKIWAEANENEGKVRLCFKDNGIGIPKEAHESIFDIFQQLDKKYEGTGIGLAIVKKGIERMGGNVGLISSPGQGSMFWLELRLAKT
ncbi:MAG: hypothetical protein JWN25_1050 [Verrucomicrobiales bacterium]|nr:hypothetical protein [Verrucomicrobiales bacterium]